MFKSELVRVLLSWQYCLSAVSGLHGTSRGVLLSSQSQNPPCLLRETNINSVYSFKTGPSFPAVEVLDHFSWGHFFC